MIETSKNKQAKKLCGKRGRGTPVFFPHELGYECPICGNNSDSLEWSEYNNFLWCKKCDIDIPSCLCVKYYEPKLSNKPMKTKERIEKATIIFLESMEGVLLNE